MGSIRTFAWTSGAALALLCALPHVAHAQETCQTDAGMVLPPNYTYLDQFFPSNDSSGIPTDSFLRLRYIGRPPAQLFVLVKSAPIGSPNLQQTLTGNVIVQDNELHWFPTGGFPPSSQIVATVPDPSSGADSTTIMFNTSSGPSGGGAFDFAGATSISWLKSGSADRCGDPNAVEVTLTYDQVTNNSFPLTEYEYVIYETRGPNIAGPVERARERGRMSGGSCSTSDFCTTFRLSSDNSSGPVCFNVQAMDMFGRPDGNAVEQCTDPSVGNYFNGCAVQRTAAPSSHGSRWWGIVALLGVAGGLAHWRRRRGTA